MIRRRDGGLKTLSMPATTLAPDTNFSPEPAVYPDGGGTSAQNVARPGSARLDEERLAPLVERARLGDSGAFEEIVTIMQGPVRAFARRMMRDQHLGDDAAQDTFLRMWKGLRTHEPRGRFVAWTFTIARNTCIEALRREKRTPMPLEEIDAGSHDPSDAHVLRGLVNEALAKLEEPFRSTLILRETGLAYEELAETQGIPVGTVRSRLHEARRRLATMLAPVMAGEA
jgi:RNA polymerase sigma-70 factor (ECF subfamily)